MGRRSSRGPRPPCCLLGSSPLLLKQGMTESLAGRFELMPLTHWSFPEMYQAFPDFTLEDYLYFGSYPDVAKYAPHDEAGWRSYVVESLIRPNIDQDIRMTVRIDKPALFRQVFELGCAYSGQILSYTKMVGHLQDAGNTTTLAGYLELLESAGLLVALQKYAGREHRKRGSQPKLLALNPCLTTAQSSYSKADALADRSFWGRLTEAAIGAHLYNSRGSGVHLYYWRDSPYEVDFVIEKGKQLTAIEVKSGPKGGSVPGLDQFKKHHPHATRLVVGQGGIPIVEFLSHPAEYWLGQGR